MTRLGEAIEKQKSIAVSQRLFMAEISRLCVAERVRTEKAEHGYTEGEDGDEEAND